jgi:hypothetical protein
MRKGFMTDTTHEHPVGAVCEIHGTETSLRCNRCGRPICSKCAVRTPTGYRCENCVRGQQKVFDTTQNADYLKALPIAGFLAFLGALIVPRFGFFTIFIAPAAGTIIAEAVRRAINRRRSKRLFKWTAAAAAIGSLLPLASPLLGLLLSLVLGANSLGSLTMFGFSLLWNGIYTFVVTTTVYYRLSGVQLRA